MSAHITSQLTELLKNAGVTGDIAFSPVPKADMGDFAFACFSLAKEAGKKPNEVAEELAANIAPNEIVEKVQAFGPYVNFFINPKAATEMLFDELKTNSFGSHTTGNKKTILVEYACPNPMKVFHLGHLRNLITGESVVRIFENAGYDAKRVNYQGDVGMHIAKSLWGIDHTKDEFEKMKNATLREQVAYLGKAYAFGATKFEGDEADESAKAEILEYNKKVYEHDESILETYKTARAWSLEYFDTIYTRLGTHFDRLYFESEVFESGTKLVKEGLEKGVFAQGDGAIIFEGSKYGLHDRVFINSQGFPTYEAKDMGLGQLHFSEFSPEKVIHVVGKEQTEYFKVVFTALAKLFPQTEGKEYHLVGGYLQLKGDQKMSSRKGKVISGDELIQSVEERVGEIMKDKEYNEKEEITHKIAVAALKYAMLKVNASQDMSFDMNESVSTAGDSGPYLLYIVTRIKSLLEKAGESKKLSEISISTKEEKALVLELLRFPEATQKAVDEYDPSIIAKYIFGLAQAFNSFYQACPIIEAEEHIRATRIEIAKAVDFVMRRGLHLLGIETVSKM